MSLPGTNIEGWAVSGFASAITLPEFNITLDMGDATPASLKCRDVLITHGHLDHFYGVVRHAYLRHMMGAAQPSRFICQPRLKPLIHDLFRLVGRFQKGRVPEYEIITISPGEEVEVRKGLFVRPFKTHHRIDSQGYLLLEKRPKLKPEYRGLQGRELGELRRRGVEISSPLEIPLLAYTGDTKASVFDVQSDLMAQVIRAHTLITECTFFGGGQSPEFAQKRGHIHLDELGERADLFLNEKVVLVHFSQRYLNGGPEVFEATLNKEIAKLPPSLRGKVQYLTPAC